MEKFMENYRPVIGLEIHVELKTQSKMFCRCSADHFGKKPNTQTCPVCLGLPGALPVPNRKAIEWTIMIAKALNCQINKISKFDRKHYFYPDLPKGYQISQYDEPIAIDGYLKVRNQDSTDQNNQTLKQLNYEKIFKIRRVHLEEDTGKLIHAGNETLIDFNRSGVPLVEIVTEPDFDNSDDVKRFLEELQVIIRYLGVSDADMEKGSMRLEPNISIKIKNQKSKIKMDQLPGYKVEIKNINSFRFVKQAIDYEIGRQVEILRQGKIPIQETRGFDDKKGITYSQRSKEYAHDYRYFPEPDIPPLVFSDEYLARITIPELPSRRLQRYISDFGLRYNEAFLLTRNKEIADFFEKVSLKLKGQSPKLQLKVKNIDQTIANLIINKKISPLLSVDQFVKSAIELLNPGQIDKKLLENVIAKVIEVNKKAVDDYKKGKQNALMFLVGEVMKEVKGKADPKLVISNIKNQISK
ncbi:MAG: Asp-tRNA(Asn)/Glu-tRNA(Gln) amidotransferase subunit GatB [Microgenomates group bacterium]